MICPFCTNDTKIYNSRSTSSGTQTWRRHRCRNCSLTFTTRERIDWDGKILIAEEDGSTSPYSYERLFRSILRASEQNAHPDGTITSICGTTEELLQKQRFFSKPTAKASQITEVVTLVLSRFDKGLALQYVNNVYKAQPPAKIVQQLFPSA